MKWVRTAIGAVIAISVIPVIILTVINVTELKDVKNVQFELLSEEEGNFFITSGTYNKLIENKNIINYDIDSNYTLITHEELDRGTWRVNDELYNKIIDRENNPRIVENVGKLVFNGREDWQYVNDNLFIINNASQFNMILNTDDSSKIITDQEGFDIYTTTDLVLRTTTSFTSSNDLMYYLSQNPLTVTYELAVKNPNTVTLNSYDKVSSAYFENNVYRIQLEDFVLKNNVNIDGEIIGNNNIGNFEKDFSANFSPYKIYLTESHLYLSLPADFIDNEYPNDDYPVNVKKYLQDYPITLTYELAQPRLVEQYDLSTFKLTFDDDRIRILFDIDEGYYLWEITNDDRLIPINGQHEIGNVWTVKFYVYEIQQPLIRSIVLLIPLIVISGLLLYLLKLVKERR